jgi:hypothetical protein
MDVIKKFRSRWSMEKIDRSFFDPIGGCIVYYWIDCYGKQWMAEGRWGFRVETGK